MAFHRNRDNDGNINLFRMRDNVISPTGRFCCEVEDATGANQTLCVIICNSASVCVLITDDGGTPTLGQNYSLTCSVLGSIEVSVTIFHWSKDGDALNDTGSSISFEPLNLRDLGVYNCAVTVDTVLYNNSMEVKTQSE